MFKVWFVAFKLVYYNGPYAILNIVRYTNTLQSFSLFNDKCSYVVLSCFNIYKTNLNC